MTENKRKYTVEQLCDAENVAKMLVDLPEEKRNLVVMLTNSFMAGMEAQMAVQQKSA